MARLAVLALLAAVLLLGTSCDEENLDWVLADRGVVQLSVDIEPIPADPDRSVGGQLNCTVRVRNVGVAENLQHLDAPSFEVEIVVDGETSPVSAAPPPVPSGDSGWDPATGLWSIPSLPKSGENEATLELTLDLVAGAGSSPCIAATVVRPKGFPPAEPAGAELSDSECFDISLGPAIRLSADSLSFVARLDGENPESQIVGVENAGSGALSGLDAAIDYGGAGATGWLGASLDVTTAPAALTLSVDIAALEEGIYSATVDVSSPDASNSPEQLLVELTVAAEPLLVLSRDQLGFAARTGGTDPPAETVDISNGGTGTLDGLESSVVYALGEPGGWLTAELDGNVAPATLTLRASVTGLAPGSYSARVPIASAVALNSPQEIGVTLNVSEKPLIALSPSAVDLILESGNPSLETRTLDVSNAGGGTLGGLLATVRYGAGELEGWLSASLDPATAPATLTLEMSAASLPVGDYVAMVDISSPEAENSPQTATVNVTVLAPPSIVLGSSSADFVALEGGPDPDAQQISLSNGGDGTLDGLSTAIRYAVGEPAGWLSAALDGTVAPTQLRLGAHTGTLPAGTYAATISVMSPVADNSPQDIEVHFLVVGPALSLSTHSADFVASEDGPEPAAQQVGISNSGGGVLSGLTTNIVYGAAEPSGWLSASLDRTTAPATVELSASKAALAAGQYSATVEVSAPGALDSPQSIAVVFDVASAPVIQLSSASAEFVAEEGGADPASALIDIVNSGAGTLSGLAASIVYGAGEPEGWLTANLDGTIAPARLSLQATTAGVAPGAYTATVSISSPVAKNSPRDVLVAYQVTEAPRISLSPDSLSFEDSEGGANPPTQGVLIANAGGGTLSGLQMAISYGSGSGWLTVSTPGGTTAPTVAEVNVTTAGLSAGSYSATVTVSSAVALNTPQEFVVRFDVLPRPLIGLSSTSVDFSAFEGGADPDSQLIAVTNVGGETLSELGATISYGSGTDWLQVSFPAGTTAPADLMLRATVSGLPAGLYTATVSVTSPLAPNSPQDVAVSLSVIGPLIQLSSQSVALNGFAGRDLADSLSVDILNAGGGTLDALSASIKYGGGPPSTRDWLTVSFPEGDVAPATIQLRATGVTLEVGSYAAIVSVSSPAAGNNPQDIAVSFEVAGPSIGLSASSVAFEALEAGADPDSQVVDVFNAGGELLTDLAADVVYGTGAGWLQAELSSTTAPASLILRALTGGLQAGNYEAMVSLSSAVASNSPQQIFVSFSIQGPSISLSTPAVGFVVTSGTGDPAPQVVLVSNGGGGTLGGLGAVISYGGGEPAGWLDASFLGGTTAPAELTLTATAGVLAVGSYTATVSVQSADATNSPQLITVGFEISPP